MHPRPPEERGNAHPKSQPYGETLRRRMADPSRFKDRVRHKELAYKGKGIKVAKKPTKH